MKYILLNDLKHIIIKEKKTLLLYMITLFLLSILYVHFNYFEPNKIIIKIFGLNCNFSEFKWLEILSYIFSVCIFVLISIKLFVKDMKNNLENIF